MELKVTVSEYCNRDVVIIEQDESIENAAALMRRYHTGDLVVIESSENRRPIGIITDRDLVVEVLAISINYSQLKVGDIMNDDLLVVNEGDSILDALQIMANKGVRRAPVVNKAGYLEGIFTLDDYIDYLSEQTMLITKLIRNEQVHERDRLG